MKKVLPALLASLVAFGAGAWVRDERAQTRIVLSKWELGQTVHIKQTVPGGPVIDREVRVVKIINSAVAGQECLDERPRETLRVLWQVT
jgi:hypothetical protein